MTADASREQMIEVEGVRLRAVLDGTSSGEAYSSGPAPLVVLHGFTGGAESMSCVSEQLSKDRLVVRLELVGHGRSDAPAGVGRYSMQACAGQIVAAVGALKLESPALMGYSMGGRAALSAAIRQPGLFSSLILVGATAGIADPQLRRARVEADKALADRIESKGIESFVDAWMALPIFASQSRLGEAALAHAREERLANSPHGLANSLRGMGAGAQPPLFDRLDGFQKPVLLVVGEEDEKFREIATTVADGLANPEIAILAEAGHAAHLEAPAAFGRIARAFLDRTDRHPPGPSGETLPNQDVTISTASKRQERRA
jgi:2-succinyl-6-hydroxy-2,4-cyclohexadiene-1-carboxylate synthase